VWRILLHYTKPVLVYFAIVILGFTLMVLLFRGEERVLGEWRMFFDYMSQELSKIQERFRTPSLP